MIFGLRDFRCFAIDVHTSLVPGVATTLPAASGERPQRFRRTDYTRQRRYTTPRGSSKRGLSGSAHSGSSGRAESRAEARTQDDLDVVRMREHVDGLYGFDSVTTP